MLWEAVTLGLRGKGRELVQILATVTASGEGCPTGAMDAATAKPQPGRGARQSKPTPLLPSNSCCCLPLVGPKWKPETEGAQMVPATEGSFPECRAE